MIATSVLTSLINFAIMWNSANTLRKKAHHEIDVEVVRRGSNDEETLQTINSLGLLPGDFFYLEDGMKVPCDCLIISGEV
jgi:magnesium-transporting ATPase (P-type)